MDIDDDKIIQQLEDSLSKYRNNIKQHYNLEDEKEKYYYADDLLNRYIIYKTRCIDTKKRNVYYSKILNNKIKNHPNKFLKVRQLQNLFENGSSVHEYQSRELLGNNKKLSTLIDDAQLAMLNVNHLHLTKKGGDALLFVFVDNDEVYFLDVFNHKHKDGPIFYLNLFLEILASDFPHLIEGYKLPVCGPHPPIDTISFEDAVKGGVTMLLCNNGNVYAPPGGGITTMQYTSYSNKRYIFGTRITSINHRCKDIFQQLSSASDCISYLERIA